MKQRIGMYRSLGFAILLLWDTGATAAVMTFNGGVTEEAAWQAAAGNTVLEDFESYPIGAQLSGLPALGLGFSTLAGGGTPQIYNHHECCNSPYGTQHLGNFPNGINAINQFDDISMFVLSGSKVTALGFWNGDGQADTLVASFFDGSNNLLGTVGASKGTFAGILSDVAISRVVFDGNTGDGWNHLDGLQTNLTPVPISSTLFLFAMGLSALGILQYRRSGWNF